MAKLQISGRITKNSVNEFTLKPTASEFSVFIVAFGVLKYAAMLVSVASGFAFFYYKLSGLIGGFKGSDFVSVALAVILLVCLELITNTSLSKGFKMLFKGRIRAALGCFIIASLFFIVSFNISCQGIYLALSDTHKQDTNTATKYQEQRDAVRDNTKATVARYQDDIKAIQPYAWAHYQLTTEQLRMRESLRNAIDSCFRAERLQLALIDEAEDQERKANSATATTSAEDYRQYVAVILLLELLANAILQYYNKQILHETDKAVEKDEFIADYVDEARQELGTLIESSLGAEKALYMSKIRSRSEQERQEAAAPRTAAKAPEPPRRGTGFVPDSDTTGSQPPAAQVDGDPAPPPSGCSADSHPHGPLCNCKLCGQEFEKRTTWQAYCCDNHRYQYNANRKGYAVRGVAPDYVTYPNILKE